MTRTARVAILLLTSLLLSCTASAPSAGRPSENAPSGGETSRQRTLVVALRLEPKGLALRPPTEEVSNVDHRRIFNADIANVDEQAVPRPYLVEALPEINSDTWKVFPDGRMETTYRLRPNLTWHDGAPLTAGDFVFGWRVYAKPDVGLASQPPFNAISEVEATDDRTFVVRWKQLYPDAAHMTGRDRNLPALPRHLLEESFNSQSVEDFVDNRYWTHGFVGLGPYRVTSWEPGAYLEAAAFDGHATGRPKIDRMKLVFISDPDTVLANMLSGDVDLASATALRIPQSLSLQQQWQGRQGGSVFYQVFVWHGVIVQFLPGLTTPRSLTDVRVRRALAHSIDKPGINEAIFAGIATEADFFLPPNSQWGPDVQRGVVKHDLDVRLADQLMREAGYEKGPDGIYSSPTDGPFAMELRAGTNDGNEAAILAKNWETAGFKADQRIIPPAQAFDLATKFGYPGVAITTIPATERTVESPVPGNIPTPDNGWRGGSQLSWTDPTYTDLVNQFISTLDRDQRGQQMTQMAHVFGENLPAISLVFPPNVWAAAAGLKGPHEEPPETNVYWNIETWVLQ
ncbi:MAG TPA: ABC transporter substrate-binding protein [Chloroflexota bacterium]|nr:ABC transporter substrate-binding protein [Chloroflexota bacterium]